MSTDARRIARRTYGQWIPVRSPGVGGTGLVGTGVIILGLVVSLLVMLVGGPVAMAVSVGLFLLLFLFVGTPAGTWVGRRLAVARAKSKRENQWRSGAFSRNEDQWLRLPGMLGKTTLLDGMDLFGNEFGVVKWRAKGGYYTIVARCIAEGPTLQDQARVDAWVGCWGSVLATAGQEPGLVGAKAIADTAPDPGGRLASAVLAARDPNSPPLARAVMDACIAEYPAASSQNVTYIELTFKGRALSRRGKDEEIMAELGRKIPGLITQLQEAGGGAVSMVTVADFPKIVRSAYDPAAARLIEDGELRGTLPPEPLEVAWREAGPVAEQAGWDTFMHDSGRSVTWEMVSPSRSAITELAPSALLRPHRDFVRKRVALVYRPHTVEQSTKVAERDASTASFNAGSTKSKVTAMARAAIRNAEQASDEVAYGAALTRFSILVTATVTSSEDLLQAATTIQGQAGRMSLKLRRSYGSQSSAFAATLPIGFIPWEHTAIPAFVKELK